MDINYRNISLLVCLFFFGCQVGPDYEAPCVAVPDSFVEGRGGGCESVSSLSAWWEQFNDPVLNSLVEAATCSNFDVRIALERIEERRALLRLKSADLWPQIDAAGDVNRSRLSQNLFSSPFRGPEFINFFQTGLEGVWELDFWGKLRRSKEAALYELQATQEALRDAYLIVISDVATSYVSLRLIQHLIQISEKRIALQEELVVLIENRQRAGLSSQILVEKEKEALEVERASLIDKRTSFKETLYSLAVLLGMAPEDMAHSFETIDSIPNATGRLFGALPSEVLKRRPDLRKAERELAVATAGIGVEVAELFPQFSLLGSFRYESNHDTNWFKPLSKAWTVGPLMRWPILDFGRIRAKIVAQRSVTEQALFSYQQAILEALKEVEVGFVTYFNGEKELVLKQGELAAKTREKGMRIDLFTSGLESVLESLNISLAVLSVEEELAQKEALLASDLIVIYKALGGGW